MMGRPYLKAAAMVLVIPLASAAPASAMMIADFVIRADALRAKGPMAILEQAEVSALTAEVQAAATAYRAEADQAKAKGDKSFGCPPPKGSTRITQTDILESLRAFSTDRQKTMSVKAGFYEMMKKRYPCG